MAYKSDSYYIEKVRGGNTADFRHLVDKHKDRVFNLSFRICGNREDAEEVAQDTFVKAYRSLNSFKQESSFATWLYRIAYNTSISFIRAKKDHPVKSADFQSELTYLNIAGADDIDNESNAEYRKSLLSMALINLNEEERGLITLYYYEEISTEDIARVTGLSRANVKVKLFRARQKMAEKIEEAERKNLVYNEQV